MFEEVVKHGKTAVLLLLLMTLVTGLLYPLLVTSLAQVIFPWRANGSLIERDGTAIGSVLIGQSFTSESYFWGRPSATTPFPYNGAASAASNSGPSNATFLASVQQRVNTIKQFDLSKNTLIPVDLVTASASGLDPEISPYAAFYQIPRIAKARLISEKLVQDLVEQHIKGRTFLLLGEPRINVLELNLALDNLRKAHGQSTPKS
ncbi:MAG: potassium-transporting ATPase subunit KdpC [Legionella sp.]|jgi:K+-transporting ATPase ATPase C chain